MLLPVKAICPKSKVRSDGTCLVFIRYRYNATQCSLLNTEISIPIAFWNKKDRCLSNKLPLEKGDYEELNKELFRQLRMVEDLVIYANNNKLADKGAFVKKTFLPTLDTASITGAIKKEVA